MKSNRKKQFLQLVDDWSFSDQEKLKDPLEPILIHQHLIARLRVMSPETKGLIEDAYSSTSHASSLFIALAALFTAGLTKYPVYATNSGSAIEFDISAHFGIMIIIYFFTHLMGYIVKRRFSDFCFKAITLALHSYAN